MVIGIGINVKTNDFPDDIEALAGSLQANNLNHNQLIAYIVTNFLAISKDINDKSFLETYRANSLVIDQKINYYKNGNKYEAVARGIDDWAGLIIENPDGSREVLNSGEISVRLTQD